MTMTNQGLIDNWITAAQAGDQLACEALYHHFVGAVYRLAYGVLLHEQDAEEVVQDSFSYAFRQIDHYDPSLSAFKTWLFTITMSRCRNKRRRKWLPTVRIADIIEQLPGSELRPEAQAMRQHGRQSVHEALQELSPKLREAVVLRYFEGMTYREMGDVLGCPQKTAESRVRLAHEALFRLLVDQRETLFEELSGYEA
jgi:RNA polymerase sigma-70 factor (ECF subfamily)